MTQPIDPVIGTEVDGYRILDVLGQGGMGVVYKAQNLALDRTEALKVITPALVRDAQFLRRFRLEAQTLARIHHPNIVTVYTLRHATLGHYITMEYVEGQTLADVIVAQGVLPWSRALPIIRQLLAAFDYAHEREIIHRDIKPRNIMLTGDGTVKVMDFGLAKFYQRQDVTRTQGVAGTLQYMSPEQVKGHAHLDQRSDLFSLGLTLYELLSGRLPFDRSDSQFGIQRAIVEDDFPLPHRFNATIPEPLSAIIMKALEKDPDHRYAHAREMLEAVNAFEAAMARQADTVTAARAPTANADEPTRRQTPFSRKGRTAAAVLVLGSLLAGSLCLAKPDLFTGATAFIQGISPFAPTEEQTASMVPDEIPSEPNQPTEAQPETEPPAPESNGSEVEETPPPTAVQDDPPQNESAPPDASANVPTASLPPSDVGTNTDEVDPVETSAASPEEDTEGAAPPPEQAEATGPEETNAAGADDRPAASDSPDEAVTEEPEAAEPEPVALPEERVWQAALALQAPLERAVVDQVWSDLPEPLAAYFAAKLDGFTSTFDILGAGAAIGQSDIHVDGTQATVPITLTIEYRQKGREAVKALPIPAMLVWEDQAQTFRLVDVRDP